MGEIISDDEIPYGDEIRLDGGWVDLISSAKQISSERSEDFIAPRAISLKSLPMCGTIGVNEVIVWLKTNLLICQQNLQFKS